jgi:hypothetical protein
MSNQKVVLISYNGLLHAIFPNGEVEAIGAPMSESAYSRIEEIEEKGYATVMHILNKDGNILCS